jgi:hypothetical protein
VGWGSGAHPVVTAAGGHARRLPPQAGQVPVPWQRSQVPSAGPAEVTEVGQAWHRPSPAQAVQAGGREPQWTQVTDTDGVRCRHAGQVTRGTAASAAGPFPDYGRERECCHQTNAGRRRVQGPGPRGVR